LLHLTPEQLWDIDTPDDWARAEAMFAALGMDDAARARR